MEPRKGHFLSDIYHKKIETRKLERKSKRKNISFNRLIISFKRYNKSLKRYKIYGIKTRKIKRKLNQEKQKRN